MFQVAAGMQIITHGLCVHLAMKSLSRTEVIRVHGGEGLISLGAG